MSLYIDILNIISINSATYVTSVSMKPTVTVTIGSLAVIVCNITLNTAIGSNISYIGPDQSVLNYYWYHNNIDITNRSEILEQNKEINATTTILNITSVQPSNAGVYNCTAGIIDGDVMTNNTDLCLKGEDNQIFNKKLYLLFCFS